MLGAEVHVVCGKRLLPEGLHHRPLPFVRKHCEVADAEVAARAQEAEGVAHLQQGRDTTASKVVTLAAACFSPACSSGQQCARGSGSAIAHSTTSTTTHTDPPFPPQAPHHSPPAGCHSTQLTPHHAPPQHPPCIIRHASYCQHRTPLLYQLCHAPKM